MVLVDWLNSYNQLSFDPTSEGNRKLEFDIICPQIYNWMDKRTYDSHGNRISGECFISFDDFIRDFGKVKKNILKACWAEMIESGKIYKDENLQNIVFEKTELSPSEHQSNPIDTITQFMTPAYNTFSV